VAAAVAVVAAAAAEEVAVVAEGADAGDKKGTLNKGN